MAQFLMSEVLLYLVDDTEQADEVCVVSGCMVWDRGFKVKGLESTVEILRFRV